MKTFFILFSLMIATAANGQTDSLSNPTPSPSGKSAVGIYGGLPGVGLEYAYSINHHINLRGRGAYFRMADFFFPYSLDGRNLDIGLDAAILNFDVLFEYLPFKASSFKIIGGLSYISNLGGSAKILIEGNTRFGEMELTPEQVGELGIELKYSGLAPYAGIGFGRAVPKRRIGFGMEVGTYYLKAPEVKLTATNLLAPSANSEQESALEEALSSFRWMPTVLFKIAIKLN